MIWLASAPGSLSADEESGKHGLFTKHLINALGVPGVALKTLDGFVRSRVRAESKNGQIP